MAARAIYYDTETTGVRFQADRIIEIAGFEPETGRTFEMLINPEIPIPKEASDVNKITDEMVKDAPTFKEVAEKWVEFCDGDTILIAHNNDQFDCHFLRHEFERVGLPLPNWGYIDTLKWARRYRKDLPRHGLQVLRECYGFEANNAHRALDDVIMLHKVFSSMIDDLPIETVYALANQKRELKVMPFGKYQGKKFEEIPMDYFDWLEKNGAFDKPENQELKESVLKLKNALASSCS